MTLDTMAAAYASAGNFPQAVNFSQNALAMAKRSQDEKLKKELFHHLLLFKANKSYVEPPPPKSSP